MVDQAKTRSSMKDTAKLAIAVLMLLTGVVGFYYFGAASTLYRVLALLAIAGVAVAIVATTQIGQSTLAFLQDSRTELRKVVWPTRTEAVQTTLVVIAVVILVGIFLWLVDMGLGLIVRSLIGAGG